MKIFDEQHEMFRQAVRSFVEKEVEPHVEAWEGAGQIPKSIKTRAVRDGRPLRPAQVGLSAQGPRGDVPD